jgi:hypothetical protein
MIANVIPHVVYRELLRLASAKGIHEALITEKLGLLRHLFLHAEFICSYWHIFYDLLLLLPRQAIRLEDVLHRGAVRALNYTSFYDANTKKKR